MALLNGNPYNAPSGHFFKPKEHMDAIAILIEPKDYKPDQPGYQGRGTENHGIADLTIFKNKQQFEDAEPVVLRRAIINNAALSAYVRDLWENDASSVSRIVMGVSKDGKNPPYLFEGVEGAVFDQVLAWVERQDTADGANPWDD